VLAAWLLNWQTGTNMSTRLFSRNALLVFAALAFASLICVALSIARVIRTGYIGPLYLVWNLLLAWVPFVYAYAAYRLRFSRIHRVAVGVGVGACAVIWLLFLPNAPYIMTDLIHLQVEGNSIYWYDLLMLLWYAWTGFLLGLASLYLMQQVVAASFGKWVGWFFAVVALSLASYGVYLGRFLRWNSWDIVSNPLMLLRDIYLQFRHPIANFQVHAFWIILAVFLIFVYTTLVLLSPLHSERANSTH
jgi:uncharacterized membrane protein